jgi:hypothetical protein
LNIPPITFIFSHACCPLINARSSKLIRPITTSLCVDPLYNHMETLSIIIMNEHHKFPLPIIPHL